MGAYLLVRGDKPVLRRKLGRWRNVPKWKAHLTLLIIILFSFVLLLYGMLLIVERNVEPVLVSLADTRMKQIASDSLREALREQMLSLNEFDSLIEFVRDDEGKVQGVVIDQYKQTALQEYTLTQIQDYLKDDMYQYMEEQGLNKMKVYFGQMVKSRLFADKGPSIEVTLVPKGAVAVNLEPKIETAGINMVLVNIMLNITMDVSLVVPFPTESITVDTQFPIATAVVVGDTPEWYWNSGSGHEPPVFPGITPDGDQIQQTH